MKILILLLVISVNHARNLEKEVYDLKILVEKLQEDQKTKFSENEIEEAILRKFLRKIISEKGKDILYA